MERMLEQIKAVMLGHAVGDALGVPVEFCDREELDGTPVTDMMGYGTYDVPAGAWSDDTSMSLAAMASLCKGKVDLFEIMTNFIKWLGTGAFTPTGETFDVGRICSEAIMDFAEMAYSEEYGFIQPPGFNMADCGKREERSNGNGSLMRIHPFVLYAHFNQLPMSDWMELIRNASSLTHAHERSVLGCLIYAFVLFQLLEAPYKDAVASALRRVEHHLRESSELVHYQRLFAPDFANIPRNGIKSSGYVVDSLEAAIWCLLTTDSYRDCVLKAVNLGGDTDTIAAIAGGLAGALYGYDAIPKEWLNTLLRRDYIEQLCERAAANWG